MKLTNEEAENILTMINSEDEDNMYIGFKSLERFSCKEDDFGYLIYLYKYGKKDADIWKKYCEKHYKALSKHINMDSPLSYGKGISLMISLKSKPEIIEMFLERHVHELINMLDSLGYPTHHLNFNLTLRKYE